MTEKIHYRKAFNSPYLSSADIVNPMIFTIAHVELEQDKTGKTKDYHNTAYFSETEIRPGEKMKPMILNVQNCETMRQLTGSHFIDDWKDIQVTVYVEKGVKFGRDIVEGLRISSKKPEVKDLTPDNAKVWENAKIAYMRDGNLEKVLARYSMTEEHQAQLIRECQQ